MRKIIIWLMTFLTVITAFSSCLKSTEQDGITENTLDVSDATDQIDDSMHSTDTEKVENKPITEPSYKSMGYRVEILINEWRTYEQEQDIIFSGFETFPADAKRYNITKIESVDELGDIEGYDESFFEDKILLRILFGTPSGSFSYYVSNIYIDESRFAVGVSLVMDGVYINGVDAIGSWRGIIEVERSAVEGITEFAAIDSTNHRRLFTDIEAYDLEHGIALDMNSKEYSICYIVKSEDRKYGDEYYCNGKFEINDNELILLPNETHGNKFVFDIVDGYYVYNAQRSEVSVDLPFPDGTAFNKSFEDAI